MERTTGTSSSLCVLAKNREILFRSERYANYSRMVQRRFAVPSTHRRIWFANCSSGLQIIRRACVYEALHIAGMLPNNFLYLIILSQTALVTLSQTALVTFSHTALVTLPQTALVKSSQTALVTCGNYMMVLHYMSVPTLMWCNTSVGELYSRFP